MQVITFDDVVAPKSSFVTKFIGQTSGKMKETRDFLRDFDEFFCGLKTTGAGANMAL
jgi:hypothetical protein